MARMRLQVATLNQRGELIGHLLEKENEVIAAASRLLAARVTVEGSSVTAHDAAIEWSIQTAIGLVGGVREEIEAFIDFVSQGGPTSKE